MVNAVPHLLDYALDKIIQSILALKNNRIVIYELSLKAI